MKVDINDFDVIRYLDSRNIHHKETGDNVSRNWTSMNCIFCIDHSNHLGINLKSKVYSCYLCGEKGNIFKFIQEVDGVNWQTAKDIVKEFNGGTYVPKEKHFQSKLKLPNVLKEFPQTYKNFLISRRYDPDTVIQKYNLMASSLVGNYNHRIIIPVKMNDRMLSFVGRDITGKAHIPYKNSDETECIKDPKRCLYNMDNVIQSKAVIVEGIFDAWRIGDGAVATFGTEYTHEQLLYLKNFSQVFVLYDADTKFKKEKDKLAYDLSAIVKEVKVIELDEGDPDNLSEQDIKHLRREIGL